MPPWRGALTRARRDLQRIRQVADRVAREMETGDVPGDTHLSARHGATAAEVSLHLGPADRIASIPRGEGRSIATGRDGCGMTAALFGRATGNCNGKGGSLPVADPEAGCRARRASQAAARPAALASARCALGSERATILVKPGE